MTVDEQVLAVSEAVYDAALAEFLPRTEQHRNTIGTLTTQFIFGTPFDFTVNLSAGSTLWNLSQGGYDGLTSFMDLSHTAMMNAIVVQDGEGGVIPFTLATDSNAMLFSELAPPAGPVPASLPLLLPLL